MLWMGLVVPNLSFFAGLAYFSPDLCVYATSDAPPDTTHPSIKESTKGGGRRGINTQVRRKISKSGEK